MVADLFSSCLRTNYSTSKAQNKKFCCAVVGCDSNEIADIVEKYIRSAMKNINHRPVHDVIIRTSRDISIIAYDDPERMDLILERALIESLRTSLPAGVHGEMKVGFAELNDDKTPDEFYDRVLESRTVLTY